MAGHIFLCLCDVCVGVFVCVYMYVYVCCVRVCVHVCREYVCGCVGVGA